MKLCVQSSYTYAYNKNAMVTKVSTHKFDLKIASVYVFIEGSNDKVSIPEIACSGDKEFIVVSSS